MTVKHERIWSVLDERVAEGRIPGYVAAVRIGGEAEIHPSGRTAFESAAAPMADDTLFRIASVSKPIGAALTLALIEDGVFGLDDEIRHWLPEVATPRVLRHPDGPLDDTVPVAIAITVRHLLTFTAGWGAVMESTPLQAALIDAEVYPGPLPLPMTGDEYLRRLGALPLAFQPGQGWLYDIPMKVLSVLLSRATGMSLSDLVAQRITGPLGMRDTAFWSPDPQRLATAYQPTESGGFDVLDGPDGRWSGPPPFEELSGGLLSTGPDLLRFFAALADGGGPVLTSESVRLLRTDHLTEALRRQTAPILCDGQSWGLGTAVDIAPTQPWMMPGRWGWSGGTGTTAQVDPARGRIGILLTQRAMSGPQDGFDAFWAAVADA
jgi:CubicO group peptidase (beta-lactamase class C family)